MKERILRLCARGKIAINLRNLEHLQTHAGEDEESAWRRLRPKLSYTGRQLDEVFLMEPSAVPATGGTTPPVPQPPAGTPIMDRAAISLAVARPHHPHLLVAITLPAPVRRRMEVTFLVAAQAAPPNRASRSLTRQPRR
jgi:hypothetical protein